MFPTSSSTDLVGRNARSAAALIKGSASSQGGSSLPKRLRLAQAYPQRGWIPTGNQTPVHRCATPSLTGFGQIALVVCSARVERLETEDLWDHRRRQFDPGPFGL